MLALQHYTAEESFHGGLHCEGSLPVTLFAVFFWDELYKTFVPGVFVSKYQDAPLDLFTAEFFDNRKKSIEEKIKFIRALDLDTFTDWMQDRFLNYNQYTSVMSNTLFKNDQHFKVFKNYLKFKKCKSLLPTKTSTVHSCREDARQYYFVV